MFKRELKEEISRTNDNILNNKTQIAEIKAKLISIDSKVTALLKMWEPTPSTGKNTGTSTAPAKCKMTLIEFAKKYQLNISFVKRDFQALRVKNVMPTDYYKMGNNGRRKRFLLSEEAEKMLLDYMTNKDQTPKVRTKKKTLTSMSKEELIREIYKKNQQLKRK